MVVDHLLAKVPGTFSQHSARRPLCFVWIPLTIGIVLPMIPVPGRADTLHLKSGGTVRGVVLEEQADRYLVSTVDGEVAILKPLVGQVIYDDPEQSYYQLGRRFQRAGRLREALTAYQTSLQLQPEFRAARQALLAVQRRLWRQDEAQLRAELRQKRLIMAQVGHLPASIVTDESLGARYGCWLGYEAGWTTIAQVLPGSAAARAGLQPGDLVVGLDGESIERLPAEVVGERFRRAAGELTLLIERVVPVRKQRLEAQSRWGFSLELVYDGWQVGRLLPGSIDSGLAPGDAVVAMDGEPTRYLTEKSVKRRLARRDALELTIQRVVPLIEQGF